MIATDLTDDQQLAATAAAMHVLSDGTRLGILLLLAEGESCVTELYKRIGCPQATASHHLSVLRTAGLVLNRRDGKRIIYRLADPAPARGVVRVAAGEATVVIRTR